MHYRNLHKMINKNTVCQKRWIFLHLYENDQILMVSDTLCFYLTFNYEKTEYTLHYQPYQSLFYNIIFFCIKNSTFFFCHLKQFYKSP